LAQAISQFALAFLLGSFEASSLWAMISKMLKVSGLACLAVCGTLFALDQTGVVDVSHATGALRGGAAPRRLLSPSPGTDRDQVRRELRGMVLESGYFWFIPFQVVFAVIYYCTVVSQYPYLYAPNMASAQLQAVPAPVAMTRTSPVNCCLSWFCAPARAAMTFDRTGTLDYWLGLVSMFACPFCTICYMNSCTDLNMKLGGPPANPISSMICTWCCACCVVAQDAESLDMATGARTEMCGVSSGAYPMPYGGGMTSPMAGPMTSGFGMTSPMAGPMPAYGGMYPQQQMGMYPQF